MPVARIARLPSSAAPPHTPRKPGIVVRIDPTLPLSWEDTRALRLGFDHVAVRIVDPSAATQRLLALLRRGVPQSHLEWESRRLGASRAEHRRLIELVAPVLLAIPEDDAPGPPVRGGRAASDTRTPRVAVFGAGRAHAGVIDALGRASFSPVDAGPVTDRGHLDTDDADHNAPDLAVVIERFIEPADLAQTQLRQRVPHLLIGFGDRGVRVGPVIEPGGPLCVSCLHLYTFERDPGLPLVAAQLIGLIPASETEASAEFVASFAVVRLLEWIAGDEALSRTQWWLPVTNGLPSAMPEQRALRSHPRCACGSRSETGPVMRRA